MSLLLMRLVKMMWRGLELIMLKHRLLHRRLVKMVLSFGHLIVLFFIFFLLFICIVTLIITEFWEYTCLGQLIWRKPSLRVVCVE